MKKFKISSNERERSALWHEYQSEVAEEQQNKGRKAEHALLESAQTQQEFCQRREAQQFLVVEPDLPLDEMTMSDYMKVLACSVSLKGCLAYVLRPHACLPDIVAETG